MCARQMLLISCQATIIIFPNRYIRIPFPRTYMLA